MTEKQEALQCCVVPRSLSFPYGNNTENLIAGKFDRNPEVKSRELNHSSGHFQAVHLIHFFGRMLERCRERGQEVKNTDQFVLIS